MQQHTATTEQDDMFWLYRISFMYYALIGCTIVWIIGYPVSVLTGCTELTNENVLAPFMRRKPIDNSNEMTETEKTTNWSFIFGIHYNCRR